MPCPPGYPLSLELASGVVGDAGSGTLYGWGSGEVGSGSGLVAYNVSQGSGDVGSGSDGFGSGTDDAGADAATVPTTVNLDDVQGLVFYVLSLSSAQNQYYCYRVEVGVSVDQDFSDIGTPAQGWDNERCRDNAFIG